MELTIADLKPFLPGLEDVLDDEAVSEVMVNGPAAVFVERAGRLAALDAPALTAEAVARGAIQIARPLGEDPATDPIIDARLADGSRVAVCSPPAAPATVITIRRFGGLGPHHRGADRERLAAGAGGRADRGRAPGGAQRPDLGRHGLRQDDALGRLVSLLPAEGRVISIEDTLELRLRRSNGLRFEARGLAGRGVTIRTWCGTRFGTGPITSSSGRCAGPRRPISCRPSAPDTAAASPQCMRTTQTPPCRGWRPAPCRRATRCRGRSSAAAWSTASRRSSTRRGRPKGSAEWTRWCACGTTTQMARLLAGVAVAHGRGAGSMTSTGVRQLRPGNALPAGQRRDRRVARMAQPGAACD